MTMNELMEGVQTLVSAFQHPMFLSFVLLLTFTVMIGVKRIFLE
ncbi:hypothetical protein [Bacillus sp. FJAT-27264]|nr:hypothetical protein [Bacillus sp. FJAT-27264]